MTEGLTAWRAYLYAVSFVALIVTIAGTVNLIAIAIEVFVYPALLRCRSTTPGFPGVWRRSRGGSSSGAITGCCS